MTARNQAYVTIVLLASLHWPPPLLAAICERPFEESISSCASGEVLDDGTADYYLGSSSSASRRTYVQRFSPSSHPAVYHRVCVAWSRDPSAPTSRVAFEIVVYDDDGPGGDPGTLLAAVPATASAVPTVTSGFVFSSVPIAVPVTSGSIYLGFRYDPSTELDFSFPVDNGPETPQQRVLSSSNDGGSWLYTTSLGRALFVRAGATVDYAVVPAGLEASYGNSQEELPFRPNPRYQQVYLGSELGKRWITEIRLRAAQAEEDERLCPDLLEGLRIALSTTPRQVDDLSDRFSDNVGPDETVVFDGDLWLSGRGDSVPGLHPFDIVIPLQRPFYFSGADNLLLDINTRNDSLGPIFLFDSHNAVDSVSRAFCAGAGSCTTGDASLPPDSEGLVTMFLDGGSLVFLDGFESGDLGRWSHSVP